MHKEPTQIGMPILSVLAAFPGPRDTDSACMIHLSAIRPVARLQRLEPMHGYQRAQTRSPTLKAGGGMVKLKVGISFKWLSVIFSHSYVRSIAPKMTF